MGDRTRGKLDESLAQAADPAGRGGDCQVAHPYDCRCVPCTNQRLSDANAMMNKNAL